jgi:hypothetical protein
MAIFNSYVKLPEGNIYTMTIHDFVPWLNEAQSRGEIFRPHSQPHFTGPRAYAFGLPKIATGCHGM